MMRTYEVAACRELAIATGRDFSRFGYHRQHVSRADIG